jgi:hypothetical protein
MELQFEELEAETSENTVTAEEKTADTDVKSFTRRRPVRAPLPAHLPRERVVVPAPCACPLCGGRLAKLGEDITETLEVVPRQWKVIQTVREKFTCRSCEKITQPPAPFHAIARARGQAGAMTKDRLDQPGKLTASTYLHKSSCTVEKRFPEQQCSRFAK